MSELVTERPHQGLRVITVSGGDPFERGVSYGHAAQPEIRRLIAAYSAAVRHFAGLEWADAVAVARSFRPVVEERAPGCAQEIAGIAEGAGVSFDDVLAINCRSELLYGYPSIPKAAQECTALAIVPEKSAEGHMLLAQNWDWLISCASSVVLLVVRRDDGPDYLTVVEAGLLAKTGMNSAGLGLCTNTLIADENLDRAGLPYHVLLRRCLDFERVSDAASHLFAGPRAVAGNYLLAHRDGAVVDVETLPGTVKTAAPILPADGVICHTNHVVTERLADRDAALGRGTGTLIRYDRVRRGIAVDKPGVDDIRRAFRDHANFPVSVCLHPNEALPEPERSATLASVIYDLTTGEALIAGGTPCTAAYVEASL